MPLYDIINWQKNARGTINFQLVGTYDGSAPRGQQLKIDEGLIRWTAGQTEVSFCHYDKQSQSFQFWQIPDFIM